MCQCVSFASGTFTGSNRGKCSVSCYALCSDCSVGACQLVHQWCSVLCTSVPLVSIILVATAAAAHACCNCLWSWCVGSFCLSVAWCVTWAFVLLHARYAIRQDGYVVGRMFQSLCLALTGHGESRTASSIWHVL